MNKIALSLIIAGFFAGAFISSLDPQNVVWAWYLPALICGSIGVFLMKKAQHKEASSDTKVMEDINTLEKCLKNISANLTTLTSGDKELPTYEMRFEIDRLFREDLTQFAEARQSMVYRFDLQEYANVMSAFAAGERYINRVWSASTDGYVDEVNTYLQMATKQFAEANEKFQHLLASQ